MPRQPRNYLRGRLFHVTSHGVSTSQLFRDDADRRRFVWQLNEVTNRFGWRVVVWCLMGTHYHLVIEADQAQMTLAVHRLNCLYAMYFNRRHKRKGHLFGDRFSAWVIHDENHFHRTIEYVLDNPSKAGFCRARNEWLWSGPAELKSGRRASRRAEAGGRTAGTASRCRGRT